MNSSIFSTINLTSFILGGFTFIILYLLIFKGKTGRSAEESISKVENQNNEQRKKNEELLDLSEEVSFKSQNLIWVIKENSKEAEHLAELFENIAQAVENNAAGIEEISATIEELSSSSQLINSEAANMQDLTGRILKSSQENKGWIEESSSTLIDVSENVKNSGESIEKVEEALNNTNQLLMGIKDVTDQINLLALNASIEAARAGEAGRGFNVVAGEIKSLSEETEKLTDKISSAVEKMNIEIGNTNNIINKGIENIEGVEELASKSINSFDEMRDELKSMDNSISKLAENIENQAEATAQSTEAVESISHDTQAISENIAEVNDGIRKQSQNSSRLLDYSKSLSDISYNIHRVAVEDKSEDMLVFGVNPFTKPEKVKELYVPIIDKVSELLNKKSKTIIVPDYEALIDYINKGLIDVGWFSPMAYVEAKSQSEIIPMVTPKINGKASYNGYIFSRKESPFNNLRDLNNSSFAFVDKLSASGYIYPKYLLNEAGLDLNRDLSEVSFLGNHDNVISAVLSSEYDAGATYNEAWERAKNSGVNVNSLKIIRKTEDIPKDVIAAKPELDAELVEGIRNSFINVAGERDIKNSLDQTNITGFIKTEDSNFDVIRKYNQ